MQINSSFKNRNILIVDDNKTTILFLETMLKDDGYFNLYTAYSAKESYKVLEKEKIDIILLDVMMPDIDGIEACKEIKQMKKYKSRPIIMVTADDTEATLKKSFEAGANDFVTKPINFTNLSSRMENIFSHQDKDTMIQNQTRSAAMSEIIEVLAHQWRQPLAAITSTSLKFKVSNIFLIFS